VLLLVLVGGSPGLAHSDTGLLSLETSPAPQPLGVQVRARLVYVNDRDPASSATVTVEGTGPNGATVPPTTLVSQGDGVYTRVVVVPTAGPWTFRARSATPAATAETQFAIDRMQFPTTTTVAVTTTTAPAPPTTAPERADASDGGSDSGGAWLLAAAVIVLVAGVVAASAWWRTRRGTTG